MKQFRKLPLGGRLREARQKCGLTLGDVAERVAFKRAYICNLENGYHTNPPVKTLLALCAVYGISIQDMTDGLPI